MKKEQHFKPKLGHNLIGKRFGSLTVTDRGPINRGTSGKPAYWWTLCDCGRTKLTDASKLRKGLVKSCGALDCPHRQSVSAVRIDAAQEYVPDGPCFVCGTTQKYYNYWRASGIGGIATCDTCIHHLRIGGHYLKFLDWVRAVALKHTNLIDPDVEGEGESLAHPR